MHSSGIGATIHWCALQYSAVQTSTLQCSEVQWSYIWNDFIFQTKSISIALEDMLSFNHASSKPMLHPQLIFVTNDISTLFSSWRTIFHRECKRHCCEWSLLRHCWSNSWACANNCWLEITKTLSQYHLQSSKYQIISNADLGRFCKTIFSLEYTHIVH